jgi:hypothetical protein
MSRSQSGAEIGTVNIRVGRSSQRLDRSPLPIDCEPEALGCGVYQRDAARDKRWVSQPRQDRWNEAGEDVRRGVLLADDYADDGAQSK